MKMATSVDKDDMFNVHGHIGNVSRPVILESLRRIISTRKDSQTEQSINIGDFGTADGQASLSLVNEMIDVIQTDLGKEQSIVIYYNDQPMNDFNRLSKVIQGNRQESGQTVDNNVYYVMVPGTMFKQCLPSNTLDLAISSAATHYLSRQVCQIKDGVFIEEADDTEQRLMKEQATADWRSFVISRGQELKPGGFLITTNPSSNDNDAISLVAGGCSRLGRIVSEMARDNVISQEEYLKTTFHNHYQRKPTDFEEPFASSLPEIKKLGLELVSVKSMTNYLRQHPTFDIANKGEVEKLEYSRAIVASIYPWMHHVVYEGLSTSRTEEEKQTIIDEFFTRLQTYALDHSDHKPSVATTQVVIKKNHIE